ncbi:MAG TPA: protein kinase, partial [Polyangiales bacterium]|nr:protein kinase [Polyangiales bacterium]
SVFLAHDRESNEQVALKKLQRMDQKSVLRLKREFRSLADMHHPNLVKLYDLGCADDGWFVTMEYVDGPDLLRYANDGADPDLARDMSATRPFGAGAERAARDEQRVLDAFHQLACGVRALHEAGMLHRDLKPSNVLVAGQRVVVLDFGLVREIDDSDSPVVTQEGVTAGTPAYMAPEQAAGAALDEAADWYAFGVMLYQALSGELPIDGRNALELLMRKSQVDPPTLSHIVPGIAAGLSELCGRLLRREPADRPRGEEVLRVLDEQRARSAEKQRAKQPTEHGVLSQTRERGPISTLYGRLYELQQLSAAFERISQRAVVVHVRGASGAGKSALVERFLDELAARPGRSAPLVLRSRCYEREAMPFKALDGVLDALVRHLSGLDDIDVAHLLPAHVAELAQLFPALERLRAVERLLETAERSSHALQVRLRAELALRELFARLAARRPLVLWIDDLQWGDLDSPEILKGWQEQLAGSPILFVYSYRGDEVNTSPCLRELLERGHDRPPAHPDAERIVELSALGEVDARALSAQRLGALAQERPELVERIALESRGNPFLVSQLAALVQARHARGELDTSELSIEHLIAQARELLPPEAAAILNALAIAGRPIAPRLLLRAAEVRTEGRALLHALRGLRLIRARDVAGEHLIEVYHDRVREGVQAALAPRERARLHASLLRVLEDESHQDADWLHTLALGAGFHDAALRHGLIAAERAKQTLAFERAAELFRACLDLSEPDAAMSGELWLQLANALARCRHGVRAGEAYLEASKRAERSEALQLMRLAATHFLRSGDFTRGESIMREVLAGLELSLPESDAGMLAAIAWERSALAFRGLRYRQRRAEQVPAALLQKVELFGALTIETQAHHPLRGALLSARGLRWALEAGEPRQLARALSMSATLACVSGSQRSGRRSDELLERARVIAEPLDMPSALAEIEAARSVCGFLLARPQQVLEASQKAERLYREDSRGDAVGDYYQRFAMLSARVGALHVLGENRQAHAELQSVLQDARATNNRSVLLHLTLCQAFDDEVLNRAAHSQARIVEQRALLPKGRFGPLHVLHMLAILRTACSTNDYAWADPLLAEDWPRWQRSPVRAGGFLCLLVHSARARYRLNRMLVLRTGEDAAALVR